MTAVVESAASVADMPGQHEENKFQKAITAWRNIDLTSIMPSIDNAASDLVAHQRDSLVQRKDLAQKTKDFRKLDDASKLTEFKAILKAYQTYIDVISNQSKATHAAFLQLYTPIADAPDPYPLLEASIDSLVTAEEVLPKVREENEQLRRQVNKLTADLDTTEKRLSEERDLRKAAQDGQDAKVKAVEISWNAVLKEKQNNWEAKEKTLEEKIEHQDRLIKEIKASQEVSARMQKDDAGTSASVTNAELDIVHSELDRANVRLAEVEARNEQLRLELAQTASDSGPKSRLEDDPKFQRLQSENSSLLRKLDSQRMDKDSEKRSWIDQQRVLEREVQSLRRDRDAMRQKIGQWKDYENIKQELEVLKSIEFATGDDDENDTDQVSSPSKNTGRETLEQLLLSRNKKLSNELTLLRVSHQNLQSRLETLQEEMSSTNRELEKARNLCATLENDLEKVQQEAANHFPSSAMSVAGTYTSRYPSKSMRGAPRSSSPTSSIISGFDSSYSPGGGTLESLRQGETGSGGSNSSILPMITAQRDRFKKKNASLEGELQKSYQSIQSLRSEVAALQKDNLSLYEKTRYVSSYNRSTPASSQPAAIQIDNAPTSPGAGGILGTSDVGRRYHSAYESSLSPFSAFRSRESARAFGRMSLPERVVVQITRLVLATRTSRNLFAVYCAMLHVLVLFVLLHAGEHSAGARARAMRGSPVLSSSNGGAAAPGGGHGSIGKVAGAGAAAAPVYAVP